jgi:hypothetical protein
MRTLRMTSLLALLAAILAPGAFTASSKIVTKYRDAESAALKFTKIAVVILSPDADLRRRAEGGIARRIRNAAPASTLVPEGEIRDAAAVKARLASEGFDGALLVRPLPIETEETIEEGRQYTLERYTLTNYWGSSWHDVYLPGYVNIEKIVTVEVALYSVSGEKLIWVGRMRSEGPKSLREFLDDLVKAGAGELKKQKLI